VVASAGNNGDRIPQYPAAFPGVISVRATDDRGEVAGFDQDRGCPGDDLPGVAFKSGTSFAAPIVTGLLALAASPSPLVARLALESTAEEDSSGGDDDAKPWPTGWPTPPGSWPPTTRAPRRRSSWRPPAARGRPSAAGRATHSCPTPTPPMSPMPPGRRRARLPAGPRQPAAAHRRRQDGDRDTTTFAMTSSERGRQRVVVYRYASTKVARVVPGDQRAAGRQRVTWSGTTSSGALLRGRFSCVIETTDAAGNTSRSRRHTVRVL
jgi:hypothetical protein